MNSRAVDLKARLLKTRGRVCEYCRSREATDLHHALIRRDKRFKQLDVEENYMIVCHYCHMMGYVDSRSVIDWFWTVQCDRYGETHMINWLASLPLKIKPRFTYNAKEKVRPQVPARGTHSATC